jgi:GNAT superfamily N-acetyltransferase
VPARKRTERTEIREAGTAQDVAQARALFEEYAGALGVDLCFQGFADELATLPGAYAPPLGRLLLAGPSGAPFGCIALRPLPGPGERGSGAVPACGEVKRLYVRPEYRSTGCGRELAERVIEEAGRIGYRELKLDTLATMASAQRLYASLGFVPCAPYYANPLAGVVYMSRRL